MDEYYWHEVMDRTHIVQDSFYEYVTTHPAIRQDAELKEQAQVAEDALMELYQLIASKRHRINSTV